MIVSKKSIGLIVLFLIPRFAIGQNSVDSIVAKQDSSMAIGTDSLCSSRSVCNCKMRKFDPYKKKFNDMQLIKIIGPHIRR